MRKEQFSTQIVGHLRDKGVLIASSRNGYKIPTRASELKRYINHGKSIILPLLRRIGTCRDAILLATNNEYDILEENEFKKLKEIMKNAR